MYTYKYFQMAAENLYCCGADALCRMYVLAATLTVEIVLKNDLKARSHSAPNRKDKPMNLNKKEDWKNAYELSREFLLVENSLLNNYLP